MSKIELNMNRSLLLLQVVAGSMLVAGADYIPAPQPVKSSVEITAVYYPGTDWMSEWDMVKQVYPQIRPTLGWYDEGHPENIDWQIKWAVEHGVTSFLVDWYWCKGVQRLDHWVKAFPKAKFAKQLKWYLNWCNHNEPGAHTVADQIAVTKWWIDHYLKEDFYYKDERGRPLVVVWEWTNLERDFQAIAAKNGEKNLPYGEGLKRALDISRRLAREAGLPGIRFACFANGGRPKPEQMTALHHAGVEELFQYNFAWPQQVRDGLPRERAKEFTARPDWWKSPWRYDFSWSREASYGWWTKNWDKNDIPFWPTLATGWNSTPRDFGAASAATNRTVVEFHKVCEEAKRFCADTGCRRIVIGPMNEWQEGSYIEPNAEYGFELYDALRDVFCEKPAAGWPKNLTPADIGRPNPQFPPMPFHDRTSWDFSDGHQGWYRNPYGTQTIWPHDGEIEFFRTFAKRTPVAIRTRPKPFAAAPFASFKVRMRLKPNLGRGDQGRPKGDEVVRLMWGRVGKPILQPDGTADVHAQSYVKAILDGEWHEYVLPLAGNPDWNGTIDELWFDPSDLLYVNAEIDWMRFERGPSVTAERRISLAEYRDKMKAGWVGQIAGVCWGAPTEFRWCSQIIPEDKLPVWKPEMINGGFGQDDLYVEMTFLKSLEDYGLDVDIRQAGLDFANSRYMLWCANDAGRTNLRRGIAPPDSSHPKFNGCPNDIDYQIESDYAGLISPGLPQSVIRLGNVFGRLMNYGDGVYGGQFMGGLYAEAFFTSDRLATIAAGLACIPADSQYAEMVRDMVAWYRENPTDWQAAWRKALAKYRQNPAYQKASNGDIDVKINGAMVLLGYLWGAGDLDETIKIATRGGFDSDCNPSSAAGVLFTSVGFSKLPPRFSEKLDNQSKFSYTAYNFPALLDACERMARKVVVREGGRVEKDATGAEWFVIPVRQPVPNALELSWAPGPCADSVYSEAEYAKIEFRRKRLPSIRDLTDPDPTKSVQKTLDALFKGWRTSTNLKDMNPGFRSVMPRVDGGDEDGCVMTHPLSREKAVTLSRTLKVPAKNPRLSFRVANSPSGDFVLRVRVAGEELFSTTIDGGDKKNGRYLFRDFDVPLTRWAGQTVTIELDNEANGWMCEAAFWSKLEILGE